MSAKALPPSKLHTKKEMHLLRKLWHISAGLLGLAIYLASSMTQYQMGFCLLGLTLIVLLGEVLRLQVPALNAWVLKTAGPLMRASEVRSISGMTYYSLGAGLALLLFPEKIALLGIYFLIFADPIASYFGIKYGRTQLLPHKTLQGGLAGFVSCFVITVLFCFNSPIDIPLLLAFSLCAGIVGAASELLSILVDDNLTIPLLSGAGLLLLNHLFGVWQA